MNKDFLGMGTPWPMPDVVAKLVQATQHLLKDHDCDMHGWEEYRAAAAKGGEYVQALERIAAHPAAQVAGDSLETTVAQFVTRAQHLLIEEQEKPNPDNALVGFLCDAVRLAREHSREATAPIGRTWICPVCRYVSPMTDSPSKDQRTCPACIGTNGNHESGCYLALPSSKQRRATQGPYETKRLDRTHWVIQSARGAIAKTCIPIGATKEEIEANALLIASAFNSKSSRDETESPQPYRVRLLKDIFDDGQDHHPPGYIARKGDVVVIHSIQTAVVSHHGTGHGFVVHDGELELIRPVEPTPEPLVTWVSPLHWRCRCNPPEDMNIDTESICRNCGTMRPEKAGEPAEQLCNCGEFCNKSLGQPYAGTCRRLKQGLPVKASVHPVISCIYRDGCRKFPACMTEDRCCGSDPSIPKTR